MTAQLANPQYGRQLVEQLDTLFIAATTRLREAIQAYVLNGTRPDPAARIDGSFAYPEIRVLYSGDDRSPVPTRSFGRLTQQATLVPYLMSRV